MMTYPTTITLPRRPEKLTRRNSIRKTIRVPEVLKLFLLQWAANGGCSMNALVRKAIATRFHNPNAPVCHGPATAFLALRVTHAEWEALRAYAEAWKVPMWKALLLLLSRPYCVADRPRDTTVTHSVTHNYSSNMLNKKNPMNECAFASQNLSQISDPLWADIVRLGVREHVATDLTRRYARELLQFAYEQVSRKSDRLASPPAFLVWWLSSGLAQWHYERTVAHEEALERKRNEPLAHYHRKWSEMKQEIAPAVITPIDPEEWKRGLEHMKQVLGIKNEPEPEHVCPRCGRTVKRVTSTGLCLKCCEEEVVKQVKARGGGIA
jgi:hypothetical protein